MENQKKISDTLKGKKQKNWKRKTKEHGHASIGTKTEKRKKRKKLKSSCKKLTLIQLSSALLYPLHSLSSAFLYSLHSRLFFTPYSVSNPNSILSSN